MDENKEVCKNENNKVLLNYKANKVEEWKTPRRTEKKTMRLSVKII